MFQIIHTLHRISENYPFFQQNKNKQQTIYNTNYLSSDDDDYYQPDIFAPYTHDYKNTKMTEILMMTLTPQLRKIAIKK